MTLPLPPNKNIHSEWRWLILVGLPPILLANILAVLLGRNDFWDIKIDRPLYAILSLGLLWLWLLAWQSRFKVRFLAYVMMGGAGAFLLCKLILMFLIIRSPQVFLQELTESLIWFPIVVYWTVTVELTSFARRLVLTMLSTFIGLTVVW